MNERVQFKSDLKKRLYKFILDLINFIDKLNNYDNVSKRIGDQLLRSGTSVIGNYIEGQSASSKRDFMNYINISLKSSNESKLWLCLLRDTNRVKSEDAKPLLSELDEFSKIFASSLLKMKGKKIKMFEQQRILNFKM